MNKPSSKPPTRSCYQCEGKGYTEIRDCAGEVQRNETCSYCEGRGTISETTKLDYRTIDQD